MCAKIFTTWPQPVPFCEYIYCTFMCNLHLTRSSKDSCVCVFAHPTTTKVLVSIWKELTEIEHLFPNTAEFTGSNYH